MSDLQCPATVLFVPREALASDAVARVLAGHRLSGCFVDRVIAAQPESLAAVRGLAEASRCPLETLPVALDAGSLTQAAGDLADLYRGETVALFAPAAAIQARLDTAAPPTVPIAVAIDGDGWVVTGRE